MLALWATIVAVILATTVQAAEAVAWRVVSVHDGDTVTAIDAANTQHRIRLQGIDAPEIGQAFGTRSRDRLTALVKGKTVPVAVEGHDRFGRVLARIQIDGRDLGERLVGEGMAWHYARFDKSPALAAAQRDAKAARRGLWGRPRPGTAVGVAVGREGPEGAAGGPVGGPGGRAVCPVCLPRPLPCRAQMPA